MTSSVTGITVVDVLLLRKVVLLRIHACLFNSVDLLEASVTGTYFAVCMERMLYSHLVPSTLVVNLS